MAEYPKLTAKECEKLLLKNGFTFQRQNGSHKIYTKGDIFQVVPFHTNKTLHPKIIKQICEKISSF